MTDNKTPPIIAQKFMSGVKVVDIGDLRVARGLSRRPSSACRHVSLVFDRFERRIWCEDCETDVEAFDAFNLIVEKFDAGHAELLRRNQLLKEAEEHSLFTLAARQIDKIWRSKKYVPACPCCSNGLLPEDFKGGKATMIGKEFAVAKRKNTAKKTKK